MSVNVEYNGKSVPVANIGIVSSKEKVLLGNLERDLVLQTLGSITVQVGNKFYDLPFSLNGNTATLGLNIKNITSLDGINLSNYSDGTFLFNTLNNALYLIYNGQLITISGASDNNKMFLSYVNEQSLNGSQKERLVLNAGMYVNSINDVKFFTENDVYENMIIFCKDEQTHYVLSNFYKPNSIESWTTFYIGLNGGTIKNGLIIQNKTRENLLFLNGINDFNPTVFNGLKIGSNDSWMKTSVDIDNKSTINYNTKDFLIKSGLSPILHVSEKNIGIGGYASGSDFYNILLTGTVKLNDPLYTDKKIVSTDYTTTNITHWDGGKGFGLTHGSDNKWFFEVDDLLVRGSIIANKMILKELEVERAYATGGHMLVTDGAVVNSYSYRFPTAEEVQAANITYNGNYGTLDPTSYYYFVTFKETTEKDNDDAYVSLPPDPATVSANSDTNNIEKDTLDVDKNCPFIAGDVLLCQTASGLTAKKYYCLVSYSTNKYIAIKSNNFRNNAIYQRDNEGNPISIVKDFSIESNDALIRITNILVDNQSIYKYKERRRFIDIDGTRNQITMYDNLGTPNLFTEELNPSGFYDEINIITGIGPSGSLKLRMGELSDLGIAGLTGYGLYADNVYLKGKLIVKNDDIETELGANRGLWVLNNTNTYYLNDMISYNGSAYRCVVKHTNTVESNAIPGISSFWEIWVQKGNDGVAGTSFRYVDISGEQVFVYDQELDSFDKTNIPLSCTAFNVDYANLINIKFEWSIGGTTIKSKTYLKAEVLSGTIIDSINIYPRGINETINWDNYWVENKSISITCKVYTNDSLVYDSDVFSVYKVKNGEDSYTVLLSNEAMTVPCLPDGSFPSNIFSSPYKYQTQLQVYNGITKLIYGQDYTIAFTNGLISLVNSSTIGQDYGLLSVSGFSTTDLTIDSGSINITVNILRDSVIFLSFIKTISISKAKQGPLLDWIKEWDQNSTVVGADKIISPRIFTGTNDVNGITGVTLGRNAFGLTEVGIGGYYHSQPTFSLNTNGEFIIGAKNQSIVYQTTTYASGTNYLSFSLANGLEISADVKFKDPNGYYTLSGYVSNNTPKIYRDTYSVTVNKSNFAPTGIKDKDLWYPLSYDSGSIAYSGYFFIYDSLQTGDKWVIAGDNTLTTINGGIITSGTIQLGANGITNSGITGLTSVGDTNPVRFWAGDTFVNRNIADFKVHENGLVEIGNTNTSYALDANGLLTTGTGLILYTDPTTHAGGLSTKKLGIKPDGNVYIDGSVLVSNIAGSSENIALSQLLSYFVLKTVNGTNYLSTTYTVSSEKSIFASGAIVAGALNGTHPDDLPVATSSLYGVIKFDPTTLALNGSNQLTVIGGGGGGGSDVAWGTPTAQYTPLTVDAVTRNLSLDGHTHSYLPLSGGMLTGYIVVNPTNGGGYNEGIRIGNASNGWSNIQFGADGTLGSGQVSGQWVVGKNPGFNNSFNISYAGLQNVSGSEGFRVATGNTGLFFNGNTIWHAGNDGSGSGLDADLLRGVAPSSLAVLSATKLATTRTIWGQDYDGTGNVDGVFRALNDALPSGDAAFKILRYPTSPYGLIMRGYDDGLFSLQSQRETTTTEYFKLSLNPLGGNVLIGTTTDSGYKLDVNGTFRTIGAVYLNSTLAVTGTSTFTGLLTANGGITSNSYITASRFYTGYDSGAQYSVSCSNWFRSNGATGWLNDTYGAGILSDTANIVRAYGTNKFKVYNTAIDSILTLGGVTAANVVSSGAVVAGALNGTLPDDLPVSSPLLYGVSKYDDVTIKINANGQLYVTSSGGTVVAWGTEVAGQSVQLAVAGLNKTLSLSTHTHSQYLTAITKTMVEAVLTGTISTHNHSGTYQPVDADLTAIAGLTGTSGMLKKTGDNTWVLDTASYGLSSADITAASMNATMLTLTRSAGNITVSIPTFNQSTTGNAGTATKLSSVRTFELTGDVKGSITSDLASGVSISTTIQPNSVALGTDTTGNYLADIASSGNGISITGTAGEGATRTVASNATSANTPSTIMYRDAAGTYNATNGIHTGAVVAGALNGTLPDDLPIATASLFGVIKTGLSLNNNVGVVNINGRHYTTTSTYTDASVREITAELALGTGSMTAGTLDQIQLSFAPLTTTRGLTGNIIATATGAGMSLTIGFRKDTGSGRWYLMIYNGTASTVVRDGILISIRGQQTI